MSPRASLAKTWPNHDTGSNAVTKRPRFVPEVCPTQAHSGAFQSTLDYGDMRKEPELRRAHNQGRWFKSDSGKGHCGSLHESDHSAGGCSVSFNGTRTWSLVPPDGCESIAISPPR